MKTKVIFRADGDSEMGMGHVVRCLALAEILKNDFEISFAIQNTDKSILQSINKTTDSIIELPKTKDYFVDAKNFVEFIQPGNIVVLDGYNFKTVYQESVLDRNCKLVYIDDLIEWPQLADVIINYSEGLQKSLYQAKPHSQIYLGLKYVLLRREFLNSSGVERKAGSIKKVFISIGAADKSNLTMKFAEAILNLDFVNEIHLMVGSVNSNLENIKTLSKGNNRIKVIPHINITADELKDLLHHCDVAVCSASTIALECCEVGIPLITGFTAINQSGILNSLRKFDAAIDIGNLNEVNAEVLNQKLKDLFHQSGKINSMISNQRRMIDGKSPERLLSVFKKLEERNLRFRFADSADLDLYFKWTNDELVRANSFNQEPVKFEDHEKWYQSRLNSDKCFFYLFMNDKNIPVGQVRIENVKDEMLIGISIDKEFRGMSYGIEMIQSACNDYLQKYPANDIYAYIKTGNIASTKIFQRAGFSEDKDRSDEGYIKYKFFKKNES